jgi:hypothetical protein
MSFMNILPREKQIEVIAALCEGVGIRTASRRASLASTVAPSAASPCALAWAAWNCTTASWSASAPNA